MAELEKVIKGLEDCSSGEVWKCSTCKWYDENSGECFTKLAADALSLLKAQELPDVKPEKLEERTTKWLDQMTAEERLEEIAAILDDWDGYRTAKGLGGLINEVWAYALYPVKAQESVMRSSRRGANGFSLVWTCGKCGADLAPNNRKARYCSSCGQAVKWE